MSAKFVSPPKTLTDIFLRTTERVVLLVEGDGDKRYFKSVLDNPNLAVVECFGRDKVVEILEHYVASYSDRLYGICDRDFLGLGIGTHKSEKNLSHTDYHDIENDCLVYGSFSSFVGVICNHDRLDKDGMRVSDLIQLAINMALPVSHLRLINEVEQLALSFKDYKIKPKRDFNEDFSVLLEGIVETILMLEKNREKRHLKMELVGKIRDSLNQSYCVNHILNGKDFLIALRPVVTKYLRAGSTLRGTVDLQTGLYGSYGPALFESSCLGAELPKFLYSEKQGF